MSVEDTLKERGERYGSFMEQCRLVRDLIDVMRESRNWPRLLPDQEEAIRQIATKLSRALNGNPDYPDNWHDIAGYATLVAARLAAKEST